MGASKFAEDTRQAGKMLIDAQPTAYDVDKVVEELGEIKVIGTYPYDVVKEAIEIVKRGGIDGR